MKISVFEAAVTVAAVTFMTTSVLAYRGIVAQAEKRQNTVRLVDTIGNNARSIDQLQTALIDNMQPRQTDIAAWQDLQNQLIALEKQELAASSTQIRGALGQILKNIYETQQNMISLMEPKPGCEEKVTAQKVELVRLERVRAATFEKYAKQRDSK